MNTQKLARTLKQWPAYVDPEPRLSSVLPLCERLRHEGRWAVCSSGAVPEKTAFVREIEETLMQRAATRQGAACVVIGADKARQNQINRTGDHDGAGGAALALYMDVLATTMARVYGPGCGNPYLVRHSPVSDEILLIATGDRKQLSQTGREKFADVHAQVLREYMEQLPEYGYHVRKLVFGTDGQESVELVPMDLGRYSRALNRPELVAESHISEPQIVTSEMLKPGFVHEAVVKAEGEELWFVPSMPPAFRPAFPKGEPEPGLGKHEPMILPKGLSAVEVKFSHRSQNDRFAPLDFIHHSKKGLAEIFSGRFGLSYSNTYMGKQASDHLIKLAGMALKDVEGQGMAVGRTGSNLIFIVAGAPGIAAEKVNAALERRMAANGVGRTMAPAAIAIDASDMHTNDLRAALSLEGMGVRKPTQVLTYLDLIVGAIDIMRREIVSAAFDSVRRAHPNASVHAAGVIATVERHLEKGAVRGGDDLIWSVRAREGANAKSAERNLWKFASTWGKELRNSLIDLISEL